MILCFLANGFEEIKAIFGAMMCLAGPSTKWKRWQLVPRISG